MIGIDILGIAGNLKNMRDSLLSKFSLVKFEEQTDQLDKVLEKKKQQQGKLHVIDTNADIIYLEVLYSSYI